MMKKVLIVLLAAVGAAALLAGCDNGTTSGGGNENINITALNAKITEAEKAKEGVVEAASAGEVAQGRKWVTAAVMSAFNAAIDTAKDARSAATQAEVNSAVNALSAAIATFEAAKQNGNKTSGFNQTELTALIAEANTAKEGVKISTDGNDISPQEYWVSQSDMNALNTAISTANTASGNIDSAYLALVTAMNAFLSAQRPGTGQPERTITIGGLNFSDGTQIGFGLFSTNDMSGQLEISGNGEIQNKSVTVTLYNNSNGMLWIGSGSYYVVFMINTDTPSNYISKAKIAFSDAAPNAVKTFSDFKQYVYKYTLDDFVEVTGITIPAGGITLDEWCNQVSGMTYAQLLEAGGIPGPLYKNEALTQPFTGSDRLYANTSIYSEFNLMGGGEPSRPQIGEITGTITLTDVSSPAPQVYISVEGGSGYNYWWGESRINLSSGNYTNLSWSIPLYADDGFSPSNGNFRLYVQSAGSNNGFRVDIPATPNISSANANVGSLGAVSIKSITLSGTITVTHNGQRVPYVQIAADTNEQWWIGSTELTSPAAANAQWSMTLPAINSSVTFRVYGYQDRNHNVQLFSKELETPVVNVSGANVPGIVLNVGDVKTITLSGTITVTYNGQRVPNVEIVAYTYGSGNGWARLASPAANAPWSMTMPAPSSAEDVYFEVRGYDNNWDQLFYETVSPASPVQIHNSNVSGISLVLNYTD
jgi:predicted small secreted protein